MDLLDRYRTHPGARVDRNRCEAGQVDQEELAGFPDAEPDDGQRQIGERRNRPVEFDRRVEHAAGVAAHAHGDADGHRGYDRQEERAEDPVEAPENMFVQGMFAEALAFGRDRRTGADQDEQLFEIVIRTGDPVEFRDHHLGRRQEQGPDQFELRGEPPAAQDDHDGHRADGGAPAAPRCAVLVDDLRFPAREYPEIHGSSPLLSSP